uniref:Uncharacterized protein n=1 Tax=Timema monikensis TaxID=170555 RepID=A0A7R9ED19_9NEOP|nr:unnamed protein product [Timema monikensis]
MSPFEGQPLTGEQDEGPKILVGYVEDCLKGGNLVEEVGLHPNSAGERGLKLLMMLSFVFPAHFLHEDVIRHLLCLLDLDDEIVAPLVLSVLTFLGKYKPIGEVFPRIIQELTPVCKHFAVRGTTKQAKHAIRCLYVNLVDNHATVFAEILENVKENLNPESPYYRTAIVSVGHIAYNLPDKYPVHIKNTISRKIVKELLVKNTTAPADPDYTNLEWCRESELPEETLCKVEALKTMARWLLGVKTDEMSASKTFRMLNAFIQNRGDLLNEKKISKCEMAWLRLAAGCAMLKICEQKGVGDQFNADQFINLSLLMVDEVPQVRELFAAKLHKGLSRGIPQKCLPLDFMGFYALGGLERDKRLKMLVKQNMTADIIKRREYIKNISMGTTGTITRASPRVTHHSHGHSSFQSETRGGGAVVECLNGRDSQYSLDGRLVRVDCFGGSVVRVVEPAAGGVGTVG